MVVQLLEIEHLQVRGVDVTRGLALGLCYIVSIFRRPYNQSSENVAIYLHVSVAFLHSTKRNNRQADVGIGTANRLAV